MDNNNKYIGLIRRHKKTSFLIFTFIFLIGSFILLNFIFPPQIKIRYSQIVVSDNGSVIHAFLSSDEKWRIKTELHEIIPQLKQAIIEKEDKYFYSHPGVNPAAICRALFNNIIKRKKTSGASTITMQLARLLEPKERTHINKIREIFRALQLELYFTKEEILQMYLNLVPYGGNIEGVKSASLLYFNRLPSQLSLAQIVTLTIIPNRPTSLKPGKNNALITQERNRWLEIFRKEKIFSGNDIVTALREPLDAKRHLAPKMAPHFSYKMQRKYPDHEIIKTSMKQNVYQKVEQIAYNYVQRLKKYQINNAAVIVLNNQTRCIEAYLGSPDFNDRENAGQVDGVSAVRSPGSTLKPLIYALAFDEGRITPKTIITDVPTDFGGYAPENFDKKFNGKVSIEQALAYSLNIPAVKILEEISVPVFIQKLKQAGFKRISKDENHLGLSLALGGCGVTLEELSILFAAFANSGRLTKFKYLQEEAYRDTIQLISPASAYMVTEILSQITRPDLPNHFENSYHVPKVAWKTGTSYGRRDAWSIGYNKKYTIGVWTGNFSGKGIHELTGADIATPLLFDLFNALNYNSQNNWYAMPRELNFRYICAETGKIPADFCTSSVIDYFIPRVSTSEKCEHMKNVWTSIDETFSYCTNCLPENGYKKKMYPNYPPELIDFYKSQNISFALIPEHNPSCTRVFTDHAPAITSPSNGKEFIIDKEEPSQMMLKCNTDNEVKRVYWYINNKFYKSAGASEKIFFTPPQGKIKISCSDDKGRNSNISITVYYQ